MHQTGVETYTICVGCHGAMCHCISFEVNELQLNLKLWSGLSNLALIVYSGEQAACSEWQ